MAGKCSRRLKADKDRDVYIIIVGLCFCKEVKKGFSSCADEYTSKPFDLSADVGFLLGSEVCPNRN